MCSLLIERKELEKNLLEPMNEIKKNKEQLDRIKKNLMKYSVREGITQRIFIHPEEELNKLDLRLLCLLTEEVYKESKDQRVKVTDYFTDVEIRSSRTYDANLEIEHDLLSLPLTLKNVLMIDSENYITALDIKFIRKMMLSKLLRYNFDTQRQAKYVRRQGSIEKVANVNPRSVREIKERLLNNTLSPTTITFNALVGTSDSGNEIIYDSKKMELTITEGTFIDIIDGFHRISGALEALDVNPDIEFKFQVAIKNYNTTTAQQHIAEVATVNEINKTHIEALKAARHSDGVVRQLQRNSDLKGRVSQTGHINLLNNEIVSYKILADTIDEEFEMKTKKDEMDVAEYLADFFNYLLGSYPEAFITDYNRISKESLINSNVMFAGYVVLARRMQKEDIKLSQLTKILEAIDFNRKNDMWEKLGVLKNNSVTSNAKRRIKDYFRTIELKVGV